MRLLLRPQTHKGKAISAPKNHLNEQNVKIDGLGDSPIDLPLLEIADKEIVLHTINGPHPQLIEKIISRRLLLVPEPHKNGWSASIRELLLAEES